MLSVMAGETEFAAAKQLHDELLPKMPAGSHDTAGCGFCSPRETAAEGAGMAGETTSTVDLNDPAIKAIVDHRVQSETAALTAERDAAVKASGDAQTRIDVLEAEKAAAEQARDTVTAELAAERDKVKNEQAAASRRDTRRAALVEKVPHLADTWFNAEVAKVDDQVVTRLDRIAAMSDEDFEPYAAEIAAAFDGVEVKPEVKPGAATPPATPPRETAMAATSTPAAPAATGGSGSSKAGAFIGKVGYSGIRRG